MIPLSSAKRAWIQLAEQRRLHGSQQGRPAAHVIVDEAGFGRPIAQASLPTLPTPKQLYQLERASRAAGRRREANSYAAYRLFLDGKTVGETAIKLGVHPEYVRILIRNGRQLAEQRLSHDAAVQKPKLVVQ